MGFNQYELSEFLTHYSTLGDTVKVDTQRLEECSLLGYGELFFPNRSMEFSIHLVEDPVLTESIWMTDMDDFGSFEILINAKYLGEITLTPEYNKYLEILCVRQLTRFAINEMPGHYKDLSHSTLGLGYLYKQQPAMLDIKPEVQAFYQSRLLDTESTLDRLNYFNLLGTILLQGAVVIKEFEVDLEMLRFIDAGTLVFAQYFTMKNIANKAITTEISNRTNRILRSEYNGNVIHPEFELNIKIL